MRRSILLTSFVALAAGCGAPGPVQVTFEDVAPAAGIGSERQPPPRALEHVLDSMGSGAAIADYDGDGDEDIFLVAGNTVERFRAGEFGRNALYRNNDDGSFDDVTVEAGLAFRAWANGAYFVDYDNDGDKDLFVTAWGPNQLFRNDGGTFTEVATAAGVQGGAVDWSAGAAFGDLDFDGDLDLYVVNYCELDPADAAIDGLPAQSDRLYRNNGDGTFSDVTAEAGLHTAADRNGSAVVFSDLDNDRQLDIYVDNDSAADFLWRNDGDLRFTEMGMDVGVATNEGTQLRAGMGGDAGDYDGDGRFDLAVASATAAGTRLYRNAASMDYEMLFSDATSLLGPQGGHGGLSWGMRFLDYDNDGWLDLFVASGDRQVNELYGNTGAGGFVSAGSTAGAGLAIAESSRGVAVADLDRDGALDLVVANLDAPPSLLLNRGGAGNAWLSIELVGQEANRDGVGARLELGVGDRTLVRDVNPFGSYLSQSSYRVHFGLGGVTETGQLVIHWPSGHTDLITGLEAGLFYTVQERVGVIAEHGPRGW